MLLSRDLNSCPMMILRQRSHRLAIAIGILFVLLCEVVILDYMARLVSLRNSSDHPPENE